MEAAINASVFGNMTTSWPLDDTGDIKLNSQNLDKISLTVQIIGVFGKLRFCL